MTKAPQNKLRSSAPESAKPEWEAVGRRLTSIRGQRTQPEVAAEIGVSKTTYGRWERGIREVGADALRRLADLGWSPLWLLTGIEPVRLHPNVAADAATDTALVVARGDAEAYRRRDTRIREMRGDVAEPAPDNASQAVRQAELTVALQLAAEALGEKELPPGKHAALVSLIYELLVEGLPEAKILRFARSFAA